MKKTLLLITSLTTLFSLSQAQDVGIGTASPSEKLDVDGAVKIGNTTTNNAGTIRWNGTDFEGYDGSQWVSFTQATNDTDWVLGTGYMYNTNARVIGVGTSSPTYAAKLHIVGTENYGVHVINTTTDTSTYASLPYSYGGNFVSYDYRTVGSYANSIGVRAYTQRFGDRPGSVYGVNATAFDHRIHSTSPTYGLFAHGDADTAYSATFGVYGRASGKSLSATYAGYFVADADINSNYGSFGVAAAASGPGERYGIHAGVSGPGDSTLSYASYFHSAKNYMEKELGIGVLSPNEMLQVDGAVNLGTTSNTNAGSIRWNGTDFEGYDGSQWVSLTNSDDNDWIATTGGAPTITDNIYHSGKVAMGTITDPVGYGLYVQNYTSGLASVRGANQTTSTIYAEGQLGVLNPASISFPYSFPSVPDVYNLGVLGIKPASGANGAAVYGWNTDGNSENYAGVFVADGAAASGVNYGVYATATGAATNYAGYFDAGQVYVENQVSWGSSGVTLPSATAGWKAVLYTDDNDLTDGDDYGLGINGSTLWYHTNAVHQWYANNVDYMTLDNAGKLQLTASANDEMVIINDDIWEHANGVQDFGTGGDYLITASREGSGESAGYYGDGNWSTIWNPGDSYCVRFLDEDAFGDGDGDPYNNSAMEAYIDANGNYVTVSDMTRKQNILPVTGALAKVNAIGGYTYEFKQRQEEIEKGETPQVVPGVLAQELEAVFPEAVQTDEYGQKYVHYDGIIPLLLEAIKELSAKVEALENQ